MEKEYADIFYVEVNRSDDVRKNTLECVKEVIESLQRFEKFKESRKAKLESIKKLAKYVKDINRLVLSLKKSLPEPQLRAGKDDKPSLIKAKNGKLPVIRRRAVEFVKRQPTSELEKLESELNAIEEKIGGLK